MCIRAGDAEDVAMTVYDSLILPMDEAPGPGERPEDDKAPVCCQGWMCSYLRDSYLTIPGAGAGVHTWY